MHLTGFQLQYNHEDAQCFPSRVFPKESLVYLDHRKIAAPVATIIARYAAVSQFGNMSLAITKTPKDIMRVAKILRSVYKVPISLQGTRTHCQWQCGTVQGCTHGK